MLRSYLAHLCSSSARFPAQVIEADLVLLAMGFLGPEATLAEALGALRAVLCCAVALCCACVPHHACLQLLRMSLPCRLPVPLSPH